MILGPLSAEKSQSLGTLVFFTPLALCKAILLHYYVAVLAGLLCEFSRRLRDGLLKSNGYRRYRMKKWLAVAVLGIALAGCSSVPDDWSNMTQTEIQSWQASGFTAEVAQQWKASGFNSEAAGLWKTAGFNLESATEWSAQKFSAEEAKNWVATGFELDDAVDYRARGLSPIHREQAVE